MSITATIQARMGSSRLPGKVLIDICGKPMLQWQVERISKSRLIDNIIVCTSIAQIDDDIQEFCDKNNIQCFRGSENDVLQRISSALKENKIKTHVECHGDSPLIDPLIIDDFIDFFLKNSKNFDYVSSALKTTYPPGLEVTVYKAEILIKINKLIKANDPMREHVGYNLTRFPEKFRLKSLEAPPEFFAPEVYLEVDTIEDLKLITKIIKKFTNDGKKFFSTGEILNLIKQNPQLTKINNSIKRNWKSLREI